jgi:hypothetical protein
MPTRSAVGSELWLAVIVELLMSRGILLHSDRDFVPKTFTKSSLAFSRCMHVFLDSSPEANF